MEDDELQAVIDAIDDAPKTFEDLLPHLTTDANSYPELRIEANDVPFELDYNPEENDGFLERIGSQIAQAVAYEARTQGRRRSY